SPETGSKTCARKSSSVLTRFGVGAKICQSCSKTGLTYGRILLVPIASLIGFFGPAHNAMTTVWAKTSAIRRYETTRALPRWSFTGSSWCGDGGGASIEKTDAPPPSQKPSLLSSLLHFPNANHAYATHNSE